MFVHSINPVLVTILGIEIRWYGLVYALGIIFALVFTLNRVNRGEIKNLDREKTYDLFIWLIIANVIGARLFNVIFYNLPDYLADPVEIFNLRNGGLSFHGGLFGALLAALIFCRINRINFLNLSDTIIIPAAIGLAFGRIANFINAELYGKLTSLPWGVVFPGAEGARHPTQIYESLKNFFIFFVLLSADNIRKKPGKTGRKSFISNMMSKDGSILFLFMLLYGIMRFIIEYFKEMPVTFLGMTTGQALCLVMVIISIAGFAAISGNKKTEKQNKKRKQR